MNGYSVALFIMVVLLLAFCVIWRWLVYDKQMREVQTYPFFASRDEFIRLKIEGYFDHDPELYEWLCSLCNGVILNSKEFNFLTMLSRFISSSSTNAQVPKYHARIEASRPEVREAYVRLIGRVTVLVVHNSTFLRILLLVGYSPSRAGAHIPKIWKEMQFTKPVQTYRDLEHMRFCA